MDHQNEKNVLTCLSGLSYRSTPLSNWQNKEGHKKTKRYFWLEVLFKLQDTFYNNPFTYHLWINEWHDVKWKTDRPNK